MLPLLAFYNAERFLMELNVPERLVLLDLLPKEGRYADIVTIRRARGLLALTLEETKAIDYKEENVGGQYLAYFDQQKATELIVDTPVDAWTTNTIEVALAKLEKESKMSEKYASLYEKFIVNYG